MLKPDSIVEINPLKSIDQYIPKQPGVNERSVKYNGEPICGQMASLQEKTKNLEIQIRAMQS